MAEADNTLRLEAVLGADHWERIRCYDAATNVPVIWSDFTKITFNVRLPAVNGKLGPLVVETNSVDNSGLYRISGELLELDTSNLLGLVLYANYQCLLKGHDSVRTRGQVLGTYIEDLSKPLPRPFKITLTTSAGY